jgi:uncharacterized protein with HEPN domain
LRSLQDRLNDILVQLADVENFTREGRDVFLVDRKTQNAVARCYEVIGEVVKQIPPDLLQKYPEVAWQDIKEFRDFLIHSYHRVDYEFLWAAVEDVPNLKGAVIALLHGLEHPDTAQSE